MAKPKKLKSGNWNVQVYLGRDRNGKKIIQSVTRETRQECIYAAAEVKLDYERNQKKINNRKELTLREAIASYIEMKERTNTAPTTIYGYSQYAKHSFQSIMDVKLKHLDDLVLMEALSFEMERPSKKNPSKTVSPKTVYNEFYLIMPVIKLNMPGIIYNIKPPKLKKKIKTTLPMPKEIYEAVKGTDVELPVMLALWYSLTSSEIKGLTKSDSIDEKAGMLNVCQTCLTVGGHEVWSEYTKENTRTRSFELVPYIKKLIDEVDGDVIVPLSQKTLSRHFKKCLKDAELPDIRFHDLRHINSTMMASLQIPNHIRQYRGGWASTHIMDGVYTERFQTDVQDATRKIDNLMMEQCGIITD